MAKSFIDVVQDSPRTDLGILIKTKNLLSRTILSFTEPPFGFKHHERLVPVLSRKRLFRHLFAVVPPSRPRACSANRDATRARSIKFSLATGAAARPTLDARPWCCAPYAHRDLSSLSLM